jgi:hypothetical protein
MSDKRSKDIDPVRQALDEAAARPAVTLSEEMMQRREAGLQAIREGSLRDVHGRRVAKVNIRHRGRHRSRPGR